MGYESSDVVIFDLGSLLQGQCFFSLLKHYLELCITDTALKVSRSLYCFTTSISHGVENYFLGNSLGKEDWTPLDIELNM